MEVSSDSPIETGLYDMHDSSSKDVQYSKAISCAMKALQVKIKTLESENQSLISQISSDKKSESSLSREIDFLKFQNEDLSKSLSQAKTELQHYSQRCHEMSLENRQLIEQLNIEKQGFTLKSNEMAKRLNEFHSIEEEELSSLKRKLKDLNEVTFQLTEQLVSSSKNLEGYKKYYEEKCKTYENDILSLELKVKNLKITNDDLQERLQSKQSLVDHLQRKIDNLTQNNKADRENLVKQCNEAQNFINGLTLKINRTRKKSIKRKKAERTSSHNDLRCSNRIESKIGKIEHNLNKLNKEYRSLLQSSFSESQEFSNLKPQLNRLAEKIEKKSSRLLTLKKQHSQSIRSKPIANNLM